MVISQHTSECCVRVFCSSRGIVCLCHLAHWFFIPSLVAFFGFVFVSQVGFVFKHIWDVCKVYLLLWGRGCV